MVRNVTLAASLAALMMLAQSASAAPIGPYTPLPEAAQPPVVQAQGGYCRRVARDCAYRFGWGSWRFQRCMRWNGC